MATTFEAYREVHRYWRILDDPLPLVASKVKADTESLSTDMSASFEEANVVANKLLRLLVSECAKVNGELLSDYKWRLRMAQRPGGTFLGMNVAEGFRFLWHGCVNVRKLVLATQVAQEKRRDVWPSFARNQLVGWSAAQFAVEAQRLTRELEEMHSRAKPSGELTSKLGVAAVFEEEARFIESYVEIVDTLKDGSGISTRLDESRMIAAKNRRIREIQFDLGLRLDSNLRTIEGIQKWEKTERRRVLEDPNFTSDEKEELLAEIDDAVQRERSHLRNDISVYEED